MTNPMTAPRRSLSQDSSTSQDYGWTHWEDADAAAVAVVSSDEPDASFPVTVLARTDGKPLRREVSFMLEEQQQQASLPPQLHPAVSLGIRRMSSCYFSIASSEGNSNSVADLLSLWQGEQQQQQQGTISNAWSESQLSFFEGSTNYSTPEDTTAAGAPSAIETAADTASSVTPDHWNTSDLLYHDILMNVFTYLDAKSLAAFSETARRPNFECFYFLQLQLQRALLGGSSSDASPFQKANEPQSSSTSTFLHSKDPLSAIAGVGALARLAALDRTQAEETVQAFLDSNSTLRVMPLSHSLAYFRQVLRRNGLEDKNSMARAALFVTVIGAASFMSTTADAMVMASMHELSSSFGTELPNMLFRVGFVGSLVGAARTMSEVDPTLSMRERAEIVLHRAYCAAYGYSIGHADAAQRSGAANPIMKDDDTNLPQELQPQTPNPYEHLQQPQQQQQQQPSNNNEKQSSGTERKLPSGCVGAYSRAVARASECVTNIIKQRRRQTFLALSDEEQRQLGASFLDACCSDESLQIVQDMVETIDVEGFYVGSDGTESCALHKSAFYGSCQVLEFLCRGMDESNPAQDGGLCDVNQKDDNGWTALHFCAGANSVEAVRILAAHGADFGIEAVNGYTPLQWALRLQNKQAADELRHLANESSSSSLRAWMARRKPLSMIASRFFALIPSH